MQLFAILASFLCLQQQMTQALQLGYLQQERKDVNGVSKWIHPLHISKAGNHLRTIKNPHVICIAVQHGCKGG